MAETGDQRGMAISLAAAAMESAGHHAQSELLNALTDSNGLKVVGAVYLLGLIAAIVTMAIGGSYRFGQWLLVGPPLFFFMVNVRVNSDGVEWRFGDREYGLDAVKKADEGVIDGAVGRVSRFFLVWDALTSDIVQDMIKLLNLTSDSSDLDFITKTDRYLGLYGKHTNDPHVNFLLQIALNNKCGQYYAWKKLTLDRHASDQVKQSAKDAIKRFGEDRVVINFYNEWPQEADWLESIGKDEVLRDNDGLLTCDDLWKLAVDVVKEVEAEPMIGWITMQMLPANASQDERDKVKKRLLTKFSQRIERGQTLEKVAGGGDQALQYALNELTARLIYKELATSRQTLAAMNMNTDYAEYGAGPGRTAYDRDTARAIRTTSRAAQYQYKGELIGAALTMPYVQGLVLYMLALTFPIFAMMLVLPGRHLAILTWMGLWAWVKLWDLGFAVVMMLDNILYAMLPHGPNVTDSDLQKPESAIKAILEIDPTFSAHTYYSLMATCIFAVPVVTGFLVHKGGQELVAAVSDGLREFPTMMGNSLAAFQRAMFTQDLLGEGHRHIYQQTADAAYEAMVKDPLVREHMLRAAQGQLGQQATKDLMAMLNSSIPGGDKAQALKKALPVEQLATVLGKALAIDQKQSRGIALAQYRANLSMAAYRASYSDYVTSRTSEAQAYNWNTHDIGLERPGAELLAVEQAKDYYPMGELQDTIADEFAKYWGVQNSK